MTNYADLLKALEASPQPYRMKWGGTPTFKWGTEPIVKWGVYSAWFDDLVKALEASNA